MSLTERLSDMAIFAKVVESSGFSSAAQDLNVSKAAVSKAVARLEGHLGVRLLNRTTRKLTPTEAGVTFHVYCRQVVAQADEAEQHLGQLQAAPRGTLKLASPLSLGLAQITKVLPEFQRRYPDIEVILELVDGAIDIVGGGYDLVLDVGEPSDSSFVARRLTTSRNVIVATPTYIERFGAPQSPQELSKHACLMGTCEREREWQFIGPSGCETVYVQGPFKINCLLGLRESVLASQGIARVPSFCVGDDLVSGRLKCLLADWTHKPESIYTLYPHRKHLPSKVKAAVDYFREVFGELPYWDAVLSDANCQC